MLADLRAGVPPPLAVLSCPAGSLALIAAGAFALTKLDDGFLEFMEATSAKVGIHTGSYCGIKSEHTGTYTGAVDGRGCDVLHCWRCPGLGLSDWPWALCPAPRALVGAWVKVGLTITATSTGRV